MREFPALVLTINEKKFFSNNKITNDMILDIDKYIFFKYEYSKANLGSPASRESVEDDRWMVMPGGRLGVVATTAGFSTALQEIEEGKGVKKPVRRI